jgi:antitoxin component YwqK of YwqJK toxin-antitoxin module
MLKSTLIICFLISVISSFSQNVLDSMGRKIGPWIEILPFDSIRGFSPIVHANYRRDTLIGQYEIFNLKGKLLFECSYVNNFKEGYAILYDDNGSLMSILTFYHGQLLSQAFFSKGTDIYKIVEYDLGYIVQNETHFNKNGKPNYKIIYEKGLAVKEYWYRRNGKLKMETAYKDGKTAHFIEYTHKGRVKKSTR